MELELKAKVKSVRSLLKFGAIALVGLALVQELRQPPEARTWQHTDLTDLTGAPTGGFDFVGYAWEEGRSKQIAYGRADGHIYELSISVGGAWQHADLTGAPEAQASTSEIDGYAWQQGHAKQVVYMSPDRHIHELYIPVGGSWQHADLTQLTGSPDAEERVP